MLYNYTYMWNLKKKSQTHGNREQTSGCQGLEGEANGEGLVKG